MCFLFPFPSHLHVRQTLTHTRIKARAIYHEKRKKQKGKLARESKQHGQSNSMQFNSIQFSIQSTA